MINVVHLKTAARQKKMLTMANVVHLETAARQKKVHYVGNYQCRSS
jgi:hypothetical protein